MPTGSASPHIIRLRGPWQQVEPSEFEDGEPVDETVACSPSARPPLGLGESRLRQETIVWRRSFGRPTGLDGRSRVWLSVPVTLPVRRITLNRYPIRAFDTTECGRNRYDVGPRLAERNVLDLWLDREDGNLSDWWREVRKADCARLEIHESE